MIRVICYSVVVILPVQWIGGWTAYIMCISRISVPKSLKMFVKITEFLDAVIAGAFTVPGDGCIDFLSVAKNLRRQITTVGLLLRRNKIQQGATIRIFTKAIKHLRCLCNSRVRDNMKREIHIAGQPENKIGLEKLRVGVLGMGFMGGTHTQAWQRARQHSIGQLMSNWWPCLTRTKTRVICMQTVLISNGYR